MSSNPHGATQSATSIPPDDPKRSLTVSQADDHSLPHSSLAGDTYTMLLSGKDTAGRFCLIDMHVPPGGGPPPHRHDFEESFIVLNIPANAAHQFRNASRQPARLRRRNRGYLSRGKIGRRRRLCICSPAGQEEFFAQVGIPVATRTTAPPKLDDKAQAEFRAKAAALTPNTNRAPATWLKCARSTRRPKDLVVKVNDDFNNATIRASIWAS